MQESGRVEINIVPSIVGFRSALAAQLRDLADELDRAESDLAGGER